MQKKKKKKVAAMKSKTTKKAPVSKPIIKKTAKKLANLKLKVSKDERSSKNIESSVVDLNLKKDFSKFTEDQIENYKKWLKYQKQYADQKPENYQMTLNFDVKTPLHHKIHGWGIVMQKRDNYIDVLFESGLKTLIVNYKT